MLKAVFSVGVFVEGKGVDMKTIPLAQENRLYLIILARSSLLCFCGLTYFKTKLIMILK
jgi:hypothetical protein